MRGRKPKDEKLKILSGNPGKRPLTSSAEKGNTGNSEAFVAGVLEKPDYLDEYESKEWDRLTTKLEWILSEASAGMVLIACNAYSEMMHARKAIQDAGSRTYETEGKNGGIMIRQRPEVSMLQNARRAYHQALAELGASPVAHTRVKKLPKNKQIELPGIARLLG